MSHSMHWSSLTIENAILLYLYGTLQPSDDYEERLRNKSEGGAEITVDKYSFLVDGPGRYVNPASFRVTENFFNPDMHFADGEYDSVEDLYTKNGFPPPPKKLILQRQQYEYDIYSNDYAQRAFVWGTTGFELLSAKFSVINGVRTITEFVIGVKADNFDFEGGTGTEFINSILSSLIDPYQIGMTFKINFEGDDKHYANYDSASFAADSNYLSSIRYPQKAWQAMLVDDAWALNEILLQNPYFSYLEEDRNIIYGSHEADDDLTADEPYYSEYGVVMAGGDGNDRLAGTDFDDMLLGGDGDDLLLGNKGPDELFGGKGNDVLVGGSLLDGFDPKTINLPALAKATTATPWDDGARDILSGGEGDDIYIVGGGYNFLGITPAASDLEELGKLDLIDGNDGDFTIYAQWVQSGVGQWGGSTCTITVKLTNEDFSSAILYGDNVYFETGYAQYYDHQYGYEYDIGLSGEKLTDAATGETTLYITASANSYTNVYLFGVTDFEKLWEADPVEENGESEQMAALLAADSFDFSMLTKEAPAADNFQLAKTPVIPDLVQTSEKDWLNATGDGFDKALFSYTSPESASQDETVYGRSSRSLANISSDLIKAREPVSYAELAHSQQLDTGALLDTGEDGELFLAGTKLAALSHESHSFW